MLEEKSNQKSFIGGIVIGFLLVCTVGFFILLAIMLMDRSAAKTTDATDTATTDTTDTTKTEPVVLRDTDWYKGGKDAKVTIVEFSDIECPYCVRFFATMEQAMTTYGDKIKWVYRHAPLDSLHPNSRKDAEATECAGELGGNAKFWEMLDTLTERISTQKGIAPDILPTVAESIGLNKAKFTECLNSGRYADKVQQNLSEAMSTGFQGTPHSIIIAGNQQIPVQGAQPFESLKQTLDSLLAN